jgi:hypothetical protein
MYRRSTKRGFGSHATPLPEYELNLLIATKNEAIAIVDGYVNRSQNKQETLHNLNTMIAKIQQKMATLS